MRDPVGDAVSLRWVSSRWDSGIPLADFQIRGGPSVRGGWVGSGGSAVSGGGVPVYLRGLRRVGFGLVESVAAGVEKRRHACIETRKRGAPLEVPQYPTLVAVVFSFGDVAVADGPFVAESRRRPLLRRAHQQDGDGAGAAGVVVLSSGPQNLVSPPRRYRLPSSNSAADEGVRLRYWSTTFRYHDSIASAFIVDLLLSAMSGGRLR